MKKFVSREEGKIGNKKVSELSKGNIRSTIGKIPLFPSFSLSTHFITHKCIDLLFL